MATPLSEQVKSVGLDIANSSTSADESCSSVEHSGSLRVECDEFMGELISQKFVMKKETEEEDCRRTPLTVSCIIHDQVNWRTCNFLCNSVYF